MVGLSSSEVCGGYLGTDCGSSYDPWNQTWTISIPGNKPTVQPVPPPKVRHATNLKIIHYLTQHHLCVLLLTVVPRDKLEL